MDEVQERYMDDRVTWAVWCYMEDEWIEPSNRWPQFKFDQNSYSRWVAHEILELLLNRGDVQASIIIKQFKDKMDDYSCYSNVSRYIFSIAREAADDILDVVRAME